MGKMPRRRLRDLSIVQNTTNSKEVSTEQQTVVGSSSVLETHDESVEFQTRNANMLPINYESWHNMPDSNKNQALSNIKPRRKIAKCPTGNADAVRFWNLKKGEDRERVGTSCRQKQKFKHTAGSKNFACVAQAAEASSGQKVGRLQLFDITHRKKDGTPMSSEAAEIMEKLKDKKAEYEATALTDSSVNFEDIDNIIINEVLGPERYGRIVQIQASTDEQISQLRAEAAAREAEQNRKYNELQQQLQSMMTMFQQFQNLPS
ncbi:hypothetical protein GOBAR_AA12162 [Gossypium barbadense]|uniref:Uncharacterized protein n=1 Tax=Gossypium barbadense TaxID=3634 RepID=A0A2P5XYV9_GOSBA|nr:hypothetical protein GOBAR_AA12162 [Gossypium barbadense]